MLLQYVAAMKLVDYMDEKAQREDMEKGLNPVTGREGFVMPDEFVEALLEDMDNRLLKDPPLMRMHFI